MVAASYGGSAANPIKERGPSKGLRVLFVLDGEDFIEPMGPPYLAGAAKAAGHTCQAMILGNTARPMDVVRDYKPHLIAYSAVTGVHQRCFRFNQQVMDHFPEIFTLMGGAHPTNYPDTIERHPIHAICVGEGEGAFVEVLDRLAAGQWGEDLWDIQNLAFKGGPRNPKRPLIADLDTLPFPDRDTFFRAAPRMARFPLKMFMTSRGCPFPCTYCFEPVQKSSYKGLGKYERRHSVDHVIAEILDVKSRWPVEFVKFDDDLFVLRRQDPWLEEFAERFPKEVGIPFNALVRVDSIDEWMAERLQAAGCKSLTIAADSANPDVRLRVIKKRFTNEQIIDNFQLIRRHGMGIFNNMILGLPPESPDQAWSSIQDDKDAIDMEIAAGVTFSSRSILVGYPGTEIGIWCKEKGYYDMDVDTFGESIFERSQLNCFTDEQKDIQVNLL
jgi:anaerobic magnesium-protoporphyrin IX monomethyl ester cyclase